MAKLRLIFWLIILTAIVSGFGVAGCSQKRATDVEFVPTPQLVVVEMLKMAGVTKDDILYDLGCGDGRIVITAATMFGAHGIGVELDPFLIRQSTEKVRRAGVGDRVKIIPGDFFKTNLGKADVVTLYLTPELNLRLRSKFFEELRPGSRIVSHDFNMGDWRPDNMGRLRNIKYEYPDRSYARDAPYYLWIVPANVAGLWRWTISSEAGSYEVSLHLFQKFQDLAGKVRMRGREMAIVDPCLAGDRLSFILKDDAGKEDTLMWFNGRIKGNTIQGSLEVPGGQNAGNYNWDARRDS